MLTFETTMTNVSSADLTIGSPTTRGRENAGYGGLFWRGPRSFTGGTLLAPDFAGGEEVRGSRGPWMGFVGKHDDTGGASTVVVVDGDQPLAPAAVVRPHRAVRLPQPGTVLLDGGALRARRHAAVPVRGGHRRRGVRPGVGRFACGAGLRPVVVRAAICGMLSA